MENRGADPEIPRTTGTAAVQLGGRCRETAVVGEAEPRSGSSESLQRQPRNSATATRESLGTAWGQGQLPATWQEPGCDPAGSGTSEMSLTLAVWSREAVAARARGPPKPQHRSVMGRLCRDQTCRGSGIWEGSACNTLWGEQRRVGQPGESPTGSWAGLCSHWERLSWLQGPSGTRELLAALAHGYRG